MCIWGGRSSKQRAWRMAKTGERGGRSGLAGQTVGHSLSGGACIGKSFMSFSGARPHVAVQCQEGAWEALCTSCGEARRACGGQKHAAASVQPACTFGTRQGAHCSAPFFCGQAARSGGLRAADHPALHAVLHLLLARSLRSFGGRFLGALLQQGGRGEATRAAGMACWAVAGTRALRAAAKIVK